MTIEPIAIHDQKAGFAGPGIGDHFAGNLRNGLDISAIHTGASQAEGNGSFVKIRICGGIVDARAHAILIVYTDKQYRKTPQRGHIHALIENALAGGAIAKKSHRYRI